jgi:hypothetical protein
MTMSSSGQSVDVMNANEQPWQEDPAATCPGLLAQMLSAKDADWGNFHSQIPT